MIDKLVLHSPSVVSMGNPRTGGVLGGATSTPTISPRSVRCWKHYSIFSQRANITLCKIESREHIVIRTWERGAGLTKACGSAACAAAVAAVRGRARRLQVRVTLAGGDPPSNGAEATITWSTTGPVVFEFEGRFIPAPSVF